ncbi:MucR family transcriptional regulator [Sphingomonas sp. MMS24-J13]|uniref:MucR family transcriptional regulator n=1 Tax=Sphingomonas sp. MMS24-J13 TaxID=3238686 RepID=UPI00384D990F
MSDENSLDPVELATELTIAWLGNQNNRVQADDVPAFLRTMHATVLELSGGKLVEPTAATAEDAPAAEEFTPAVTVRKSLASRTHIVSMIDGKPYKMLKRHLAGHGLTPAQYRERYKLKPDYPMVAPEYSEARRVVAQQIGLGSKGRSAKAVAAPSAKPAAKAAPKAAPVAAAAAKPKQAPRTRAAAPAEA